MSATAKVQHNGNCTEPLIEIRMNVSFGWVCGYSPASVRPEDWTAGSNEGQRMARARLELATSGL